MYLSALQYTVQTVVNRPNNSSILESLKYIFIWVKPSLTRSPRLPVRAKRPERRAKAQKKGGGRETRHLTEGDTTRWKSAGYNNMLPALPGIFIICESISPS